MLEKTMDRLLAALLLVTLILLGLALRPEAPAAPAGDLRAEPHNPWTVSPEFSSPRDVVVDLALVHKSRASLGESLLAGAGIGLPRGEQRSIRLWFNQSMRTQYTNEPISRVSLAGPLTMEASEGFQPVEVDTPFDAQMQVQFKYLGTTAAGAHLMEIEVVSSTLEGVRLATGLALGAGAVLVTPLHGDYLLLIGLSEAAGPGVPSNRLGAWRQRAREALAVAPVTNRAMDLAMAQEELELGDERASFTLVDPAIELASLAVFLGDRELLGEARVALDGTTEQVLDRLDDNKPWANRRIEGLEARGRGHHWMEGKAAVVLSGALPYAGKLAAEAEAPRLQGPNLSAPAPGQWHEWILAELDAMRMIALDPDPELLDVIVSNEIDNDFGTYHAVRVHSATRVEPGSSAATDEAWARLKGYRMSTATMAYQLLQLPGWMQFALFLLPWLFALFWMALRTPSRRGGGLTLTLVAVFLVAIHAAVGDLSLGIIVVPFLLAKTTIWRPEERGPKGMLLAAIAAIACCLGLAGLQLSVIPATPYATTIFGAGSLFALVWLGYQFAADATRWDSRAWHQALSFGIAMPLLPLLPMDLPGELLLGIWGILQVRFLFASRKLAMSTARRRARA